MDSNPTNPTNSAGAEHTEEYPPSQEESYATKLTAARKELADLNTDYTAQLARYRSIPPSVKTHSLTPPIESCRNAFENPSSADDPVGRMMSDAKDVLDRLVEEWRTRDMYGEIDSSEGLTKDERSKIWEEWGKIEGELGALEKLSLRLFPLGKGKRRAAGAPEGKRPERRRRMYHDLFASLPA
ncbi:hypothetical protein LTR27_008742 [Elasticomyces elasticus]|nr:hypothetical protein LTR27_008742 [Elasticomyces elasticus]